MLQMLDVCVTDSLYQPPHPWRPFAYVRIHEVAE